MERSLKHYCVVETRMGYVGLVGMDGILTRSSLPKPTYQGALAEVKAGLLEEAVENIAAFGELPKDLRGYFNGEKVDFSNVAIDLREYGLFYAKVILAARKIPYGTTVTYGELARMAGSPGAARAVGRAMALNKFPIVVPCHRVVASGGKLGGFSSGAEWKLRLLKLEGVKLARYC
ncbi:MAG: methylated-DNA--[protein]-cysteine S-methyltransferase [Armatimonadetes bacterium]|nr:methylated-DNA--[protein]-cysteine S-methyltransferase [Armatimonadota bacterium]